MLQGMSVKAEVASQEKTNAASEIGGVAEAMRSAMCFDEALAGIVGRTQALPNGLNPSPPPPKVN